MFNLHSLSYLHNIYLNKNRFLKTIEFLLYKVFNLVEQTTVNFI